MARCRITMLCSLLPVKYASADANSTSATTRRSAWMPPPRMTDALVSPRASTAWMPGNATKKSSTAAGRRDDTTKSMSPMTSFQRLSEPAVEQRVTSGCSRNAVRMGSAAAMASTSRWRDANCRLKAMASRILDWDLSPKPSRPATRPPWQAASSDATESMPSSSWSLRTFLGPSPWMPSSSSRPGGTDALSSSW